MTMLEIAGLGLGVLGSIGGALWLMDHSERFLRKLRVKWSLRNAPSDFYYKSLELGTELSEGGAKWSCYRDATIVVKALDLDHIELGNYPRDATEVESSVESSEVAICESYQAPTGYTLYRLKLKQPLTRGQEFSFHFKTTFHKAKAIQGSTDSRYISGTRRVDLLILKTIFRETAVSSLEFQILDTSDRILVKTPVKPDRLTLAYVTLHKHMITHYTHCHFWHYG